MVKNRILSAGHGINAWLQQRITAVIMLVAIMAFFAFVVIAKLQINANFTSWQQFFHLTFIKIFTQITILAIVVHAWVGMRDLWMDYVKCAGLRVLLHSLTILWLIASLIYSVKILWA
ncbi:MAG: succinate dehydrogenase, hydrophobic rane anchor protein [Pseudomonadota bacterium]|jgi:succinate dehydrogenase / fumarate reductase membrane anchor subunit